MWEDLQGIRFRDLSSKELFLICAPQWPRPMCQSRRRGYEHLAQFSFQQFFGEHYLAWVDSVLSWFGFFWFKNIKYYHRAPSFLMPGWIGWFGSN
jgi:hypothetical protein